MNSKQALLIGEAIAANVPVLLLVDVNTRHIADELARHPGIATDGDHVAYLVLTHRNTTGADEHAVFRILSNETEAAYYRTVSLFI